MVSFAPLNGAHAVSRTTAATISFSVLASGGCRPFVGPGTSTEAPSTGSNVCAGQLAEVGAGVRTGPGCCSPAPQPARTVATQAARSTLVTICPLPFTTAAGHIRALPTIVPPLNVPNDRRLLTLQ